MRRIAAAGLAGFIGFANMACGHGQHAADTHVEPPTIAADEPPEVVPPPPRPWEGLEIGDDGMIYSREAAVLLKANMTVYSLPVGTRVRFLGEEDGEARIKVREGDHAELVGTVLRMEVRPLPSHKQ